MRILVRKGATADAIEIQRRDGSTANTTFPHKGPVPHDLVHLFVELELGMDAGFWGLIAAGRHPEEIGGMAKVAGHASATRRRTPDSNIVPAIQAERVVECFEADLWGGGSDPQTFNHMIDAGCQQSLVPTIVLEADAIRRVRRQLIEFQDRWAALPVGSDCTFDWPDDASIRPPR